MNLHRTYLGSIGTVAALLACAQVRTDAPIVLSGATPADRQLTGLSPTVEAPNALNAGTEQAGQARFVTGVQGTLWQIDPPSISAPIIPGTQLMIDAPEDVSGTISVRVGSEGPFPLQWRPGIGVDGSDIPSGSIVSVVFDGTAFQVLNGRAHVLRDCPEGMVAVGQQFCIEPEQRAGNTFFQAAIDCGTLDRRLCTWSEMYRACTQAAALGLTTSSSDWEWTGDSANEQYNVRMVRFAACTNPVTRNAVTGPTAPSRCCYSR